MQNFTPVDCKCSYRKNVIVLYCNFALRNALIGSILCVLLVNKGLAARKPLISSLILGFCSNRPKSLRKIY